MAEPRPNGDAGTPIETPMQMHSTRVMIADDSEDLAALLRQRLEREPGWVVVAVVDDGDEVVDRVLELRPEVLLLDLGMPGRSSIAVIEELRSRAPGVRVIVVTAHHWSDLADRVIDAGAWGFVSKFAETTALIGAIRTVLAGQLAVVRGSK